MPKKLTIDNVDERLIGRSIKRVSEYINSSVIMQFQCLICNNVWQANFNGISAGNGCPKCSSTKLTNEYIDSKLANRNIKRIDDYVNAKTRLHFQCTLCDYIFNVIPNCILIDNSGCAKCYGNAKLTNEEIDFKLLNRNIKRIDNYPNNRTPINFQCLICSYIWKTGTSYVVNQKTGCPKCKCNKNEKLIFNILEKYNLAFEYQKRIKELSYNETKAYKVDFYFPQHNFVIEYNGQQHYEPVRFGGISKEKANIKFEKQISRDIYVSNFCKENNIELISIDGRKYFNSKLNLLIINNIIPMMQLKNELIYLLL